LLSQSNFSLAAIVVHLFGFIRFPGAFCSTVKMARELAVLTVLVLPSIILVL